jgi:hypothetical protein
VHAEYSRINIHSGRFRRDQTALAAGEEIKAREFAQQQQLLGQNWSRVLLLLMPRGSSSPSFIFILVINISRTTGGAWKIRGVLLVLQARLKWSEEAGKERKEIYQRDDDADDDGAKNAPPVSAAAELIPSLMIKPLEFANSKTVYSAPPISCRSGRRRHAAESRT